MDIKTLNAINLQKKKSYHNLLIFSLLVFQIVGIFLAILKNDEITYNALYGSFAFIIFSLLVSIYIPKLTKGDSTFIFLVNFLYSISLVILLRLDSSTAFKHILWYFLGIFVFFIAYNIMKYFGKYLKDKFWLYFAITLLTFLATLVLGFTSGGAKNWISIGGFFTIQLSEFAKISYVFMIASFYNNYDDFVKRKFGKYYLVFSTYLFSGLFFLQGELGTAVLLFAIMLGTMFIFERRYTFIILNILIGLVGVYLASFVLSHIKVRIDIWLNPWSDANGRGYQIIQGLFSIANGGFFGTGIGLGRPELVPVVESDFIITAIMEEMGIFMGFSILMMYILMFYKSIKVSLQLKSKFYSSLALSIGLLFAMQTLIIFGGVLKLIPLTGITTPFLSYGGSSMIANFALLSVLQYLTARSGDWDGN
ncbi:FtsW/RodA/SpoVE family cell cycle protein [Helcococcus kunzii]|uniref:FtsW/RodA/SpoVE family cell cycle protein n=1 Tax=Helcococcus kunzii TaxID=40091 RepID=UPI0024ACEF32|nr:FtsW/RodA/SpoVE family cell cycle protein [Helcococcus kunzii]